MDTTAANVVNLCSIFLNKTLLIKPYCLNIKVVSDILIHESVPRIAPPTVLREAPHRGLGTLYRTFSLEGLVKRNYDLE